MIEKAANQPLPKDLPEPLKTLRREIHQVLQQANQDYARIQYNTVVSACMKMLNTLEAAQSDSSTEFAAVMRESLSIFLRVLYPVVPHITYVIWQELGYENTVGDLLNAPWPEVDASALEQDEIEMVVQVNGKLRSSIRVPKAADKAAIETIALENENVRKFITGTPKRVIVVPNKLVNIVV